MKTFWKIILFPIWLLVTLAIIPIASAILGMVFAILGLISALGFPINIKLLLPLLKINVQWIGYWAFWKNKQEEEVKKEENE